MSKELLLVVDAFSNEKNIDREIIFDAMEQALAMATSKFHGVDMSVRVVIDRKSGEYESFRCWEVIDDAAEMERPDAEIMLSEAAKTYDNIQVGDVIEEPIDSIGFGRIAAQTAKQVLVAKVREAEKARMVAKYRSRIGQVITGQVKRVTREFVLVDLGEGAEGMMLRSETIAREAFRMSDRVKVMISEISDNKGSPQIMLSRTHDLMVKALFETEVPEIAEEVVEMRAVARVPGVRAKVAVKTNDGRMDPVGACVGMRGSRVQAVSNELQGERIDVVLWDDNPPQLVINAMAPTEVLSIVIDDENGCMDVAVPEEQLAQAIGRNGQNVRLVSRLVGWDLNVMAESEAKEKQEAEHQAIANMFVTQLSIDDDLANSLCEEGFSEIQEVAYVELDELMAIEGIDQAMAEQLHSRANDALLAQALTGKAIRPEVPANDLLKVEGMTKDLAYLLAKNGVITRDDLAELSIDDLIDIEKMDSKAAGELIMKARAHWFED